MQTCSKVGLTAAMLAVVLPVAADPMAIGFGSIGHKQGVSVLPIVVDSEAVFPTPENIVARRYPLAHYLSLCFAKRPTEVARDFVRFAVNPKGQEIVRRSESEVVGLAIDLARE